MADPAFLPIGEHLERGDAPRLVGEYFHEPERPERGVAGRFFERLADRGVPAAFTAGDLLAVAALGADLPPHAAVAILGDEALASVLAGVPTTVAIVDAEAQDLLDGPCTELWERLRSIPGVGAVTASKLLAAKRPHLVPILDDQVRALLHPPAGAFWASLRHTLVTDGALVERARTVHEAARALEPAVPADLSVLRVIDICVRRSAPRRVEDERVSDEGFD